MAIEAVTDDRRVPVRASAEAPRQTVTDCRFCKQVRQRFGAWFALAQFGFPFAIGFAATPVGRFRAFARRSRYAHRGAGFRLLINIAMTLGWPVGAFVLARRTIARMRKRGQAPCGRQVLLDMYWLALRCSIPPLEYALYRLNEADKRGDLHEFIYWNDMPALAALAARTGADNKDVQDKNRFAAICGANGLPHVQQIAAFKGGRQITPDMPFIPDAPALWVKSLGLGTRAAGSKWILDGDAYRDKTGRRIPPNLFAEQIRHHDCIVQRFVENHHRVSPITNGALAALRIVTGMNARGRAEFVTSLIALPHGASETTIGGINCSIERETGRITHALKPIEDPVSQHPDTGASIVGLVLPFWQESIDLVLRAHAGAFPRFAFLGWDVALTEDGPFLIESNSGWGAIFHQMLEGPIGHTAFSRLVGQYV